MIFSIGDKFVVQGILCEVRVINRGWGWVAPCQDEPMSSGHTMLSCVTFEVLDENGFDSKGRKALTVNNMECGAI